MNIPFERLYEDDFIEVPGSVPAVQVPLARVGIGNRPHYISVLDPFTNEPTRLFADVKLSLSLPSHQRGLHMSRIERMMHDVQAEAPRELGEFTKCLVEKIIETQPQDNCRVEVDAHYERLVDKNASGKPSHELLKLHSAAEYKNGSIGLESGVTAKFMNACPCAQRWGIRQFAEKLEKQGYTAEQIQDIIPAAPLQGHTQYGDVTLYVQEGVAMTQLYKILEQSSPLVRELLAGRDEGDFVREAQERGMFVEDVAREIIKNTVLNLDGAIADSTKVKIHLDVDESVHHHNLFTTTEATLGELSRQLKAI